MSSRWWRVKHAVKYWDYRPKWIIRRWRERRLTLRRGYSTFVLDEFDYHFDKMAVASLQYHLSPDCVCDNEARRPVYEDLIARLSEPGPRLTPSEIAVVQAHEWGVRNAEMSAVTRRMSLAEDEWMRRIDQARHDFVDIMRGLWS